MRHLLRGMGAVAAVIALVGCSFEFNPLGQPKATVTVTAPAEQRSEPVVTVAPESSPAEDGPADTPAPTDPVEGCVDPGIRLPAFVPVEACQGVPMADYAPQTFQTPSGNIMCEMERGQAWCGAIETQMIADTHNPEGDGQCDGYVLSTRAEPACHSLPIDVSGPTMAYGSRVAVGEHVCTVEDTGVTCWNGATGHGFFLSKAKYASW